ncbi:hypothetical protein [Cytobacillus spongiae]|jgi:hypothetical protein|nr:hypothetical protein [Cytobacillus spongiae]
MPKKQLVDLVARLKKSGINVSFTKPKENYFASLKQNKNAYSSSN